MQPLRITSCLSSLQIGAKRLSELSDDTGKKIVTAWSCVGGDQAVEKLGSIWDDAKDSEAVTSVGTVWETINSKLEAAEVLGSQKVPMHTVSNESIGNQMMRSPKCMQPHIWRWCRQ